MKKLAFFLAFILLFACEDDRGLPIEPSIRFNKIEFRETISASEPELLIVHIDFSDGDGDLGLSSSQTNAPYNEANYFYDDNGKLLTIRSRSNPAYSFLPPYEKPFDCTHYTNPDQTLYFPASAVDHTFNIVDTKTIDGITYNGINDIIYFESNPDHFNITVDFLLKNNDGSFSEFDWRTEFCNQSFDGRFPPLQDGDHALEGTLKYTMTSYGFRNLFGLRVMKLRINVKDRALHQSNTIETFEFTLDDIENG